MKKSMNNNTSIAKQERLKKENHEKEEAEQTIKYDKDKDLHSDSDGDVDALSDSEICDEEDTVKDEDEEEGEGDDGEDEEKEKEEKKKEEKKGIQKESQLKKESEVCCPFYSRSEISGFCCQGISLQDLHTYSRSERGLKDKKSNCCQPYHFSQPPKGLNSFQAHTGGIKNFSLIEALKNSCQQSLITVQPDSNIIRDQNLYNDLLKRRFKMCEEVVEKFNQLSEGIVKFPKSIVYVRNGFPCVMVKFPFKECYVSIPKTQPKKKALPKAKTGELAHVEVPAKTEKLVPSPTLSEGYNTFLSCYLIAIVNYRSITKKKLNIEMVARSSFGHNVPAIDVTGESFRIDIGLVPKEYAETVGESLFELYKMFAIELDLIEQSGQNGEVAKPKLLYFDKDDEKEFQNTIKTLTKGKNMDLIKETYWENLNFSYMKNKKRVFLLQELLFRESYRSDVFTNYIVEALSVNEENFFNEKFQDPLKKLFRLLTHNQNQKSKMPSLSVKTKEIETQLGEEKSFYALTDGSDKFEDKDFKEITLRILQGLNPSVYTSQEKLPQLKELYTILHKENRHFLERVLNSSQEPPVIDKIRSIQDEAEEQIRKVILPNGMLAINASFNLARNYLETLQEEERVDLSTKPSVIYDNMYYEIEPCLEYSNVYSLKMKIDGTLEEQLETARTEKEKIEKQQQDLREKLKKLEEEHKENAREIRQIEFFLKQNLSKRESQIYEEVRQYQNLKVSKNKKPILQKPDPKIEDVKKLNCLPETLDFFQNNKNDILFFDLNSFHTFPEKSISRGKKKKNADPSLQLSKNLNNAKKRLEDRFELLKPPPKVVVLDWTSSQTSEVIETFDYLMEKKVELIMLAASGLKHKIAGSDSVHFGTLHIWRRDPNKLKEMYEDVTKKLRDMNLDVPKDVLGIIKGYEDRGFAPRIEDELQERVFSKIKETKLESPQIKSSKKLGKTENQKPVSDYRPPDDESERGDFDDLS